MNHTSIQQSRVRFHATCIVCYCQLSSLNSFEFVQAKSKCQSGTLNDNKMKH